MKGLRVAMLVPSLGIKEGQGGVDLQVLMQLSRAGASVTVFVGNGAENLPKLPGVIVKRIPRLPAWQLGNLLVSLATTTPRLRRRKFDIVHADPAVALRRADVMLCHTVSGVWRSLPEEIWREPGFRGRHADAATRFKAWLELRQFKRAGLVLVSSERSRRDLLERGVKNERIRMLPFGIDSERFRPPSATERSLARESLGIASDAFVTCLIGPHGPRKGLPLAVASAEIADSKEVLLVAGDRRGGLWEERARDADVSLVAPGKLEDVRSAYWASDVMLHPSRYDAFGMAVLEAMACGLPTIVSRQAGAHELVRDAGFVLCEHSPEALRAAIDALKGDPARREGMGKRARELALNKTWDETGQALLKCYAEVTEDSN